MKNSLPASWCVKNDGSRKYLDTVVRYLEDKYNFLLGGKMNYYGARDSMYNYDDRQFGTLLTIDEFVRLTSKSPARIEKAKKQERGENGRFVNSRDTSNYYGIHPENITKKNARDSAFERVLKKEAQNNFLLNSFLFPIDKPKEFNGFVESAAKELSMEKTRASRLLDALIDIEETTDDNVTKKLAGIAKERYYLDGTAHAKKLFSNEK